MRRLEALGGDLRVIAQLLRGMPRSGSHGQRLDGFYGRQAEFYDRFRERLLGGRRELIESLAMAPGSRVVELGAGTGRSLDFFPRAVLEHCRFELVDLCAPLLAQARKRFDLLPNVRCVHADAGSYQPEHKADLVLVSYALSMMPCWEETLANARSMLAIGGRIAVVDFHVSAATTVAGQHRHGWLAREFWPRWFAHDGVQVGPHRLQRLIEMFPEHALHESAHPVPYMLGLKVPIFRFVGIR